VGLALRARQRRFRALGGVTIKLPKRASIRKPPKIGA